MAQDVVGFDDFTRFIAPNGDIWVVIAQTVPSA